MFSLISLLPPKQDVLINKNHKHSFSNKMNSFIIENNKMKTIRYAYLKGKNKCKSGGSDKLSISFYFIGDKESSLSKSQSNRMNGKRNKKNNDNTVYSAKEKNFRFPSMKNNERNLTFNKTFKVFMKTKKIIIGNQQQRKNNNLINSSNRSNHSLENEIDNNNMKSYCFKNKDSSTLKTCSSLSTKVHNNNANVSPFFQNNKTGIGIYNKNVIRKTISNVTANLNSTTNSSCLKKEEDTYRSNSNDLTSNISKVTFLPTVVDKPLHEKKCKKKEWCV